MTCTCGFQHLAPHLGATCTCEGDEMDAMASETVDERPRVWDCSECGQVVVCGNCDGRRRAHLYVKSEPAEPWLTSALPDGGEGAEIEARGGHIDPRDSFAVWSVERDGWVIKGVGYFIGRPGAVFPGVEWRWVTRPASEASEPEQEVCWLCSPDECDCPCGATNDAQAPLAKPTGLSREGVARERRESWRLGSREELIAKVETERGYVRDLMGQMRRLRTALGLPADTFDEVTVSRAICAVESRFEARFAEASARAGWVQAEQERDEARAALAEQEESEARYKRKYERKRGDHRQALGELKLAREALAEFNGTDRNGWRDQCISLRAELAALRQVGCKMGNERNEAQEELAALREEHAGTVTANIDIRAENEELVAKAARRLKLLADMADLADDSDPHVARELRLASDRMSRL